MLRRVSIWESIIKCDIFSEMNLQIPDVNEPDEWALYITKELGYDTYVNPPGGKSFFNADKYKKQNIDLQFWSKRLYHISKIEKNLFHHYQLLML